MGDIEERQSSMERFLINAHKNKELIGPPGKVLLCKILTFVF
jgi:hypothetical protein